MSAHLSRIVRALLTACFPHFRPGSDNRLAVVVSFFARPN